MTTATQVQFRRGTTAETTVFTGAIGEVTVDTDTDSLVVHDGVTAGGIRQASQDYVDTQVATVAAGNFQSQYLYFNTPYG